MSLVTAVLGEQLTIETLFRSSNGTAFVPSSPATYVIRDHKGNLVLSGVAAQDPANPARWSANVVLPTNAPVGKPEDKYSLTWTIDNKITRIQNREFFSIEAASDFDYVELDQLVKEKSVLRDSLRVNAGVDITRYRITVKEVEGTTPVYDSGDITNPAPVYQDANIKVYQHTSPEAIDGLTIAGTTFRPYMIEWEFDDDGVTSSEFHFVYVVNPKVLYYIHHIRRHIDKAKNQSPNPALTFNDVDLAAYLDQGLRWLNVAKPTITNWNLNTMPKSFDALLHTAAVYCALSAQYLAEGQAAFDFSGQSVSLNIDRTGFIESELGRLQQQLDEKLPAAKRMWLRATGGTGQSAGVLGVFVGPSLAWNIRSHRAAMVRRHVLGY